MPAPFSSDLAEAIAYVDEMRELCRLAGAPQFATGFIESKMPVEAVNDFALQVVFGFRSRHRQGWAIAPFKDLFLGNGGFAGSDL